VWSNLRSARICGKNAKQTSTDRIVVNILRLALNDEIVLMVIVSADFRALRDFYEYA
jgi:hypothetical protein